MTDEPVCDECDGILEPFDPGIMQCSNCGRLVYG